MKVSLYLVLFCALESIRSQPNIFDRSERRTSSKIPPIFQNPLSKLFPQRQANCCPCYTCCQCTIGASASSNQRGISSFADPIDQDEDLEDAIDPILRRPFENQRPPAIFRRKLLKSMGVMVLTLEDPYFGFRRRHPIYPLTGFGSLMPFNPYNLGYSSTVKNGSVSLVVREGEKTTDTSLLRDG